MRASLSFSGKSGKVLPMARSTGAFTLATCLMGEACHMVAREVGEGVVVEGVVVEVEVEVEEVAEELEERPGGSQLKGMPQPTWEASGMSPVILLLETEWFGRFKNVDKNKCFF